MANENKNRVFISCFLVQIEWADGNTHRYMTKLGYVNYLGQNWFARDVVQGQIMSIGSLSESAGVIPNLDITFKMTAFMNGKLNDGTWQNVKITIHEGIRDPASGVFSLLGGTAAYRIADYSNQGGLRGTITFSMMADGMNDMKNYANAYTYSSESQKALTGTLDTGFRYISNQNVNMSDLQNAGGGASYGVINGYGGEFAAY